MGRAAILVGANGSGVISFDSKPPAHAWATRSIPGTELSFANSSALDAAVQTNGAAIITNELVDALGSVPAGQNALASWTSGGGALWTRPAANAATLLLATLQNNTGLHQPYLRISYTLGDSGGTPVEQVPAHQIYYSFSGAPGTWVNIPGLSGGTAGFKSNVVTLAGVWSNTASLHVLWVDDNTVGGVDRGYSIDNVFFSGKPKPDFAPLPDLTVDVLKPIVFQVEATSAAPGANLFYLPFNFPAEARLDITNGVFRWRPSRAFAGTTNSMEIWAIDVSNPALSTPRAFNIVVRDLVEVSVTSVVVDAGQSTYVLVHATSSTPLTNLSFVLQVPPSRLTNLVAENADPNVSDMTVDSSQPGLLSLNFAARAGQILDQSNFLAALYFTAAPGQNSAFVPITGGNVVAGRQSGSLDFTDVFHPGRVIVLGSQPLLEAEGRGEGRDVILYGRPNTTYVIEQATNGLGGWQPWRTVTVTNQPEWIDAGEQENAPAIVFYRAIEASGFSLPEVQQSAAVGPRTLTRAEKRKAAVAFKRWKKLRAKNSALLPALMP